MVNRNSINIRDFHPSDTDLIISLNHQSVAVLSAMDDQRFNLLREQSNLLWIAKPKQQPVGFLMGFCEGCSYDSFRACHALPVFGVKPTQSHEEA